jgi:putative transposase
MMVHKVVKAKIVALTKGKRWLLDTEYNNYQRFLQGDKTVPLHSAIKQDGLRFLKKRKPKQEYPLFLRNQQLQIERRQTTIAEFWARIPVSGQRGGIWVAIKSHCTIDLSMKLCESIIRRKNGEFFLNIVFETSVEVKQAYDGVLSVDLGKHNIATTYNSVTRETHFYGKALRRVRGHYFHLRRALAQKKALATIRKIGNHEYRIVNHELHKISKAVVAEAERTQTIITVGRLKGIRRHKKGRRWNRTQNSFPYYRLTQYIRYKASWKGIAVLEVSEAWTSQTCSYCGERGRRVNGLFQCKHCGKLLNSDYNGVRNIGKRAVGLASTVGGKLTFPELLPAQTTVQ